jgi:hypothetical protein
MSAKHTPGPWTVFSDSRYSSCLAEVGHLIVSAPHEVHEWQSDDVTAANARLIASAPCLLEALIYAREQLEAYEHDASGETYNNLKINAAIAKATGEAAWPSTIWRDG